MKRILLLDDNIDACQSTVHVLEQNYDVVKCRDVITAKRRISIDRFDLMIIDLMMPTKGLSNSDEFSAGINFYDEFVKDVYTCPVLFWTNLSDTSFKAYKDKNQGAKIHYHHKGDNSGALLNAIHEILK